MSKISKYDSILICFQDKKILKIRLKGAENSIKGEVDIVIDADKKNTFKKVIIQLPDKQNTYEANITSCSWHGYYLREEGVIKEPVIHLKSGRHYLEKYRHTGTVTHEKVFLFPICSIHIPNDYNFANSKEIGKYSHKIFNIPYLQISIDVFVLPKTIKKDDFVRLEAFRFYQQDINFFTRQSRCQYLGYVGEPFKFEWVRLKDWDVALRYSNAEGEAFPLQNNPGYSIYFFDTFNPYETVYNRKLSYGIDCKPPKWIQDLPEYRQTGKIMFKEIHEHELISLGILKSTQVSN